MARFEKALWIGPTPNARFGGMRHPIMGVVMHIEQGTEAGSEAWCLNPNAEVSAHFFNPKVGPLRQMVDTNDVAWAEADGNDRWISVEHEGMSGESLTLTQRENDAELLAWVASTEGVPLQVTDDVNVRGLGWHGMGGGSWGSHPDCPGEPIKFQRTEIVGRAIHVLNPVEVTMEFNPPFVLEPICSALPCPTGGVWLLSPSGAVANFGGAPQHGGVNGRPYFIGRTAARIVASDHPEIGPFTIIATSGERYTP